MLQRDERLIFSFFDVSLKDACNFLKLHEYTLRKVVRFHGYSGWPFHQLRHAAPEDRVTWDTIMACRNKIMEVIAYEKYGKIDLTSHEQKKRFSAFRSVLFKVAELAKLQRLLNETTPARAQIKWDSEIYFTYLYKLFCEPIGIPMELRLDLATLRQRAFYGSESLLLPVPGHSDALPALSPWPWDLDEQ